MPTFRTRHLSLLLCAALLTACGKPKQATPPVPAITKTAAKTAPAIQKQPQALAPIPDPKAEAAEKARQAQVAAEATAKAKAEAQAKALALQAWKKQAGAEALNEYMRAVKAAGDELPEAHRAAYAPWAALKKEFEDHVAADIAQSKERIATLKARRKEEGALLSQTRDGKEQARLIASFSASKDYDAAEKAASAANALWHADWKARQQALGSSKTADDAVQVAYQAKLKALEKTFLDRQKAINTATEIE